MKKTTFLLGLCSFVFTAYFANAQNYSPNSQNTNAPAQSRINWQPDYNSAVAASRLSSKPILILFTGTEWCPACMKLERDVLTKSQFASAVGNQLVFLKAEFPSYTAESIQASPFKFLLDRYRIDTFPSMVVINPEGHVLFTVSYQSGGIEAYVNEIRGKLNQLRNPAPANS